MYRARQQSLTAAIGLLLAPSIAGAWHAGSLFDRAPGGGGGGGLFYVGSPRERSWDCTACHLDPPGDIDVSITVTPPTLFDGVWTPGQAYAFTVTLENEKLGLDSPPSNQNSMVLTVLDAAGTSAGSLGGYTAADFHARNSNIIASSGVDTGDVQWTFTWTAPAAGTGTVIFYLAVVDGNGAAAGTGPTLQDPVGDDVFVTKIVAHESGASLAASLERLLE